MKRFVFLALLLIGISTTFLFAQNRGQGRGRVTVSGTVYDKEDNSSVMQATVQLLTLPDSTMAVGNVTNNDGVFSVSARPGKYVLKISFVGYLSYTKQLQLTASKPNVNVGKIMLETDAVLLKEAVVEAEAPQVTVSGDTLGYNASAYRTSEGAALEELVKKIPGAEVDDDGNVTLNGKSISKLLVDGKEFFGGDVKTGLQNLPASMVERINAYERQSDNARITGIDDGEEEAVLDLTVKKGMNQGWIGNIDAGAGTEDRYSTSANINRFASSRGKSSQLSFIGRANNVGDRRFGGGGGPQWRRSNGLNTSKELGLNYAMETEKFEFGGSVRYNYRKNDAKSIGQVENFLPTGNSSFANSKSASLSRNQNLNAYLRMEWRPDSLTTLFMRGGLSWGDSESSSNSLSATFNSDPYVVVADPNDFLGFDSENNEELDKIRVNASDNASLSEGNSLSANGNVQLTRRLNDRGRNVTLRLIGSYGDNESDRFSNNLIRYYGDSIPTYDEQAIRRYINTPTNNYNIGAEVSYSEPIADKVYLQFSYRFQYGYSESDNSTYDLNRTENKEWLNNVVLGTLPDDFTKSWRDSLQSKYAEYKKYNHDARITFRVNRETWRLSAGIALRPQQTKLEYIKDTTIVTSRNVFNFSPEVDFRYQPQKQTQLRISYRGRSSDPSMENLLPITDNSNPLNIRTGNPGLKPSFSHNMSMRFNTYNMDAQRGIFSHLNGSFTQNAISNIRIYNPKNGGWTTMPENINGNWNIFGMFGMNTALKNRKFTIDTFTSASYNNQVGYVTIGEVTDAKKNTTTNLSLGERLGFRYRNNWLEMGVNGSFNYTFEKDKLNPQNNQEPYNFSYGGNIQINAPWGTSLSTNMTNQARRGYSDASMNRNELIWNAQVAQSFMKGSLTISLEWNDILKEQSNISRSLTSSGRSIYTYNGVNSYGMIRAIYRLNIFGSKEAREKMMRGGMGRGMGGPMGRGMGMGHRF